MNLMKKLGVVAAIITVALMPAFALAQTAPKTNVDAVIVDQPRLAAPFYGVSMGAGLGAGLTIIGAGMGFARIGSAALESMARQPETAPRVQTAMIIIGALLEGATMLSLVVCILIALKNGV